MKSFPTTTCFPARRAYLRPAAFCLGIALLLGSVSPLLHGEEEFSGFLDENGNVVFVNNNVLAQPVPTTPLTTAEGNGEKLIASTGMGGGRPLGTSGHAAGRAATPQTAEFSSRRGKMQAIIEEAANRHRVDPNLVQAIVQVESGYNPRAISRKGARGLMQLIPATARRFGVSNAMDPRANLDGGIRYLKYLMGYFNGDLELSLAAYNAGENAVVRYNGVPPYQETQDYLRKISSLYPLDGSTRSARIQKFVDERGVMHFSNTDLQ